MKRSVKHLPEDIQKELDFLTESIKRHIPKCVMIILYGSYARGNYVVWDEKVEFGVRTTYQSDLDILVVTHESNAKVTEQRLQSKVVENYHMYFAHHRHATPQFITEDFNILNKQIDQGRYFYTDVVKEGIKLYGKSGFKLAKLRTLSYREINIIAQGEFDKCYPFANDCLRHAISDLECGSYKTGAFELHQACERYYHSISLVFTNYRPKNHKLKDLGGLTKKFSRDLVKVFPQNNPFEEHCYDLLCRAYIEARYNLDYAVTKEELEYMLERTEVLRDITLQICTAQLAEYDRLIKKEGMTRPDSYTSLDDNRPDLAADDLVDYSPDTE